MENKVYEIVLSYSVDDGDIERLQDYEKNVICFSKESMEEVLNSERERYIRCKGFSEDDFYGEDKKYHLTKEDEHGHPVYVDFWVYERKDGEWSGSVYDGD